MSQQSGDVPVDQDRSVTRRTFIQQAGTATAAGLAAAPYVWAGGMSSQKRSASV